MKCEKIERLISAYLDGEVTASTWSEAEKHIESCPRCTAMFAAFQKSMDLYTQLPEHKPARDLWPGVAKRLQQIERPSGARRRLRGFGTWLADFILRPLPSVRLAQLGIGVAVLLFLVVSQLQRSDSQQVSSSVTFEAPAPNPVFGPAPSEAETTSRPQSVLTSQVQKYLEKAGMLLLEVKNSEAEPDSAEITDLRRTSQDLLEETILIKEDLKKSDLAVLQRTIEYLEMVLFDIANISDQPAEEELELLKAAIVQKDLLIKIEIYDLRDLERKLDQTVAPGPSARKNRRQKI